MRIEILTVGGEILSGRTLDTNFHYLARALAGMGVPPLWHTTVPDARDLMSEALRNALQRADGIVITGGLGGTPDDITRSVLAQVLDRHLILREEILREVEAAYRVRGRTPPAMAQSMALIPQGSQLIKNPVGLAPAILMTTHRGGWICALPGVPDEMRALVDQFLLPYIERRLGGTRGWETVLRTTGVPETILAERISTEHPVGTDIAYLPGKGGVDIRLIRKPESPLNRGEYDAWVSRVRSLLGNAVYGTGEVTLEDLIGEVLVARGLTLAVAESLTGGGLGAALTRVPGASRYFLGSVVAYDNAVKENLLGVGRGVLLNHGAVSAQTAEAMALGVRRLFGADLAVSTTGIAGPTGATAAKPVGLVYIGLSSARGERHIERRMAGRTRESITARSVSTALAALYRFLTDTQLEEPEYSRPSPAERSREPERPSGTGGASAGESGGSDG